MEKEHVGHRIRCLRERAGLTQSQAAERAGIPLGTLRGWEQGQRQPLLGAAAKLADALGCSLDELAARTPPPETETAGIQGGSAR